MAVAMTIEEHEARLKEIQERQKEIDTEFAGQALPPESREEFERLQEEKLETQRLIAELEERQNVLVENAQDEQRTERPEPQRRTRLGGSRVPDDPFDLGEYRLRSNSAEDERALMRDGARKAIESAIFPHERAKKEEQQEHIERLLDQHKDATENSLSERILVTGGPAYKRAFSKKLYGKPLTQQEQHTLDRAASLTTTAGGFAVPFELDPSIILTSNGRVNPMRQIARIETTTVNDWKGVSSEGVTASYDGEAIEVSDDAPTLAQPTSSAVGARAFVPFSIEIGQDWASFGSEMARLFQDAKDELEGNKFILGTGFTQPQGLYTGATGVVSTAGATTLAVADLYSLDEALPPRFHPNATILANRKQFNRIRAFDTGGGGSLWVQLRDGLPSNLLGLPNYEASNMISTLASGASIITIGDFSYYLIQDRLGMEVELIPHLFATANNLPSGQRGLFAIWRNNGKVLHWNAFRTLKVT